MFTLTKMQIDPGKHSRVGVGFANKGKHLYLFKYDDPSAKKQISALSEIEVGYQLLIIRGMGSWNATSKITEIISSQPNKIVFKTETSTYALEYTEDAE